MLCKMSAQPEAIKLESQWMGKLSDCTFTTENSNLSGDASCGSSASFTIGSSRDALIYLDASEAVNCVEENMECSSWNTTHSTFIQPDGSGKAICRSTKFQNSDANQFPIKRPAGNAIDGRSNTSDIGSMWPIRSMRSSSVTLEENWSTNALSSLERDKQMNMFPVHQWSSPISTRVTCKPTEPSLGECDYTPETDTGVNSNPIFTNDRLHSHDVADGGENCAEHVRLHDPMTTDPFSAKSKLDCSTVSSLQQHQQNNETLFGLSTHTPVNKFGATGTTKRAASAYYDALSTDKQRTSTPNFISGSLRTQQQNMWSKSVPQHLPGLDPFTSPPNQPQPVSSMVSDHNTSYSVPDSDRLVGGLLSSFLSTTFEHPSNIVNPTDCFGPNQSSTNDSLPLSAFDEERGLQRPDGADRPDEHMWLYEDPQGRTQGSFSDAQMNEWLQAGLYFTANLRVRRTCDDTFSPLADYTSLFVRVPFSPGTRVAPIRGGITPAMLNAVATSVHSAVMSLPSDHPTETVNRSNVTSVMDVQNCSNAILNGDVSIQGDSIISVSGRAVVPPTQRSSYSTRFEQAIVGSSLQPGTLTSSSISNPCKERNSNLNVAAGVSSDSADLSAIHSRQFCQQSVPPLIQDLTSLGLATFGNGLFGYETILSGGNASGLSPGFLSALAQYLNGQPHVIGHQSATPMQQLAETAQLAAQLAAMAGAHSPNQTPMQPAQALALAQFVMARSSSSLSNNQLSGSFGKKDGIADGVFDLTTNDTIARRSANGDFDNDIMHSAHSTSWSSFANGVGNRSSTRVSNDGSLSSKLSHDNLVLPGTACEASETGAASQRSAPIGFSGRISTGLSSSNHASKLSPISNGSKYSNVQNDSLVSEQLLPQQPQHPNGSHGFWIWTDEQANTSFGASLSSDPEGGLPQTFPSHSVTGSQWVNKVKQAPAKSSVQISRSSASAAQPDVRPEYSWSTTKQNGSTSVSCNNQFKQTLSSSMGNSSSSTGSSSSPPKNSSLPHGMVHNKGGKPSAASSYISTETGTAMISAVHSQPSSLDRTAEQELEHLTQWCQGRLESVPMREKVDIPTVVELLATLDAPYEVELMVQTFLGESARTNQFIKDFLDRRRPFWQLHRERRERESLSFSQPATNAVSSSTLRSSDKKKQKAALNHDSAGSSAALPRNVVPMCWNKVGAAQSTGPIQDSQWHQIKPKGNHGRKVKKDKAF